MAFKRVCESKVGLKPCPTVQTLERKEVRLYYGTVCPESTAYQGDLTAWKELNVDVINVYSNGANYYVQDAFAQVRTLRALSNGVIALCPVWRGS